MKPADLTPDSGAPQRALITSRAETVEATLLALALARRTVRCQQRDLSPFDLAGRAAEGELRRLLLAHRQARVRLLVDDATWLETRAPRLRALQRQFSHALELRVAAADDPVGDDAVLLVDDHIALELKPSATARGDVWLHHPARVQPLAAAFDRRWESGGHNLAVAPLGLG
jgi:hypothetical protein